MIDWFVITSTRKHPLLPARQQYFFSKHGMQLRSVVRVVVGGDIDIHNIKYSTCTSLDQQRIILTKLVCMHNFPVQQ